MNLQISVIVPVYNSELVIERCLESILSQSIDNIEIICVDDGSTDNSVEVIKGLQKKTNKIKIFSQENKGAGNARNFGLKMAKGEYIGFVDADDYIDKEMYRTMYRIARDNNDLESVFCKANYWDKNKIIRKSYLPFQEEVKIYDSKEIKKHIVPLLFSPKKEQDTQKVITRAMWSGLFKKEFLDRNRICFSNAKNGQDFIFTLRSVCVAQKIGYINKEFYQYMYDNPASLSKKYNPNRFENMKKLWSELEGILKTNNICENPFFVEMKRRDVFFVIRTICHSKLPYSDVNKEIKKILSECNQEGIFNKIRTKNKKQKILYFILKKQKISFVYLIVKIKF